MEITHLGNKRTNNDYFPYKHAYNAYTFAKFQLRFPFQGGSGASKKPFSSCSRIISKNNQPQYLTRGCKYNIVPFRISLICMLHDLSL